MASIQALSPEAFAGKRWARYTDYRFATSDACCPLVVDEIAVAAAALPVAFIREGERFWPVAVQGLLPGKNLLVHPDGRWLGAYVPAFYRSHPFSLVEMPAGDFAVCVDPESPLLSDGEGALLFEADGRPGEKLAEIIGFFQKIAASRRLTAELCDQLQLCDLFEPWHLTLKMPSGEQVVQGLFRVNEPRLVELELGALKNLVRTGALGIAYRHLVSLQHVAALSKLVDLHAAAISASPLGASGSLSLDFLNRKDTISFGGF